MILRVRLVAGGSGLSRAVASWCILHGRGRPTGRQEVNITRAFEYLRKQFHSHVPKPWRLSCWLFQVPVPGELSDVLIDFPHRQAFGKRLIGHESSPFDGRVKRKAMFFGDDEAAFRGFQEVAHQLCRSLSAPVPGANLWIWTIFELAWSNRLPATRASKELWTTNSDVSALRNILTCRRSPDNLRQCWDKQQYKADLSGELDWFAELPNYFCSEIPELHSAYEEALDAVLDGELTGLFREVKSLSETLRVAVSALETGLNVLDKPHEGVLSHTQESAIENACGAAIKARESAREFESMFFQPEFELEGPFVDPATQDSAACFGDSMKRALRELGLVQLDVEQTLKEPVFSIVDELLTQQTDTNDAQPGTEQESDRSPDDLTKVPASHHGGGATEAPVPKERYLFRKTGDTWEVRYGDESATGLKDLKGMAYIAELLARPNPVRHIKAIELVPAEVQSIAEAEDESDDSLLDPVLDDEALQQYETRFEEIEEDLRKAKKNRDEREIQLLEEERAKLSEEVDRATGKRGRVRPLGASRARKAAKAVSACMTRARENLLKKGLEKLVDHLTESINLETYSFAYRPAGDAPTWVT